MIDPKDPHEHLTDEAMGLLGKEYESNQAFNEFLDGDEPVTIKSPREDVEAYQYKRSEILFWVDREAYDDERTAWGNKSLLEKHQDVLVLLRANGHLAPFRELVDAIVRQRIVPFVGAGLSHPMEMPLWIVGMRRLHDRIHNPNDSKVTALIDQGRYLEAAQALADHSPVLVNNFIRTTYRVQKVAGPALLLPRIASGCIITTNFDDAIEEVFKRESLTFDGYMHGTQHHNFFSRLVRGQRCLLKLHGDADDPHTYILTKAQYLDAYKEPIDFQLPLPKALRQIYISNSLLFLGCSLEQDWTLDLFKQVKGHSEYEIPNHYAVLSAPEDPQSIQKKEAVLLGLNIQPIWYPTSQHAFVEKFLLLALDVAEKRMTLSG